MKFNTLNLLMNLIFLNVAFNLQINSINKKKKCSTKCVMTTIFLLHLIIFFSNFLKQTLHSLINLLNFKTNLGFKKLT